MSSIINFVKLIVKIVNCLPLDVIELIIELLRNLFG